jgi:hypothetical protein
MSWAVELEEVRLVDCRITKKIIITLEEVVVALFLQLQET